MFDREFISNPYPYYHQWLEKGRIFWSPDFFGGAWVLPHHKDNVEWLRDSQWLTTEKSSSMVARFPAEYRSELRALDEYLSDWLAFIDPPRHLRIRRLLQKGFTQEVINSFRPRVQAIVDKLLDEAIANGTGQIEIMADLAGQLPVQVVGTMLGVPEEDTRRFKQLLDELALFMGNAAAPLEIARGAKHSLDELTQYFRGLLAQRRRQPGEDLISILLSAEEEGDVLSEAEIYAQCVFFLFAGYETTSNLIGNGVYSLLRHPDQLALVRTHPEFVSGLVEETLRWEGPFQYTFRMARNDFELFGQPIQKRQVLIFAFGAANRDPAVFLEPDKFDITRKKSPQLTFGYGLHHCIGAGVARMEAEIAFSTLLHRTSYFRLVGPTPEWHSAFRFRGVEALPIEFQLTK